MKIRMKERQCASIPGPYGVPVLITEDSGWVDVPEEIGRALVLREAAETNGSVSLPQASTPTSLEDLTRAELIEIAKEEGVYSSSLRTKQALIDAIEGADEGVPGLEVAK